MSKSIDNGGKYTLDVSGVFLEQCQWSPSVVDGFRKLDQECVSFAASPYYHSVCSLFEDMDEFRQQVQKDVETIKDKFGHQTRTFVNTELLYEQRTMEVLKDMGFKCFISEGSPNVLNGSVPMHVYDNIVPTLLRHINLSEDLEVRFLDKKWSGYPLIADKFASWIAGMEGDVITLYIKYDAINTHLSNDPEILGFLRYLPLSLKKHNIEMVLPEEAVDMFRMKSLSSLDSMRTARYGMHNLMGNHAQHLFINELADLGKQLLKVQDPVKKADLQRIYRYLQQSEILLEMNLEERRLGYEMAVNDLLILSDIERAIIMAGKEEATR